MGHSVYIYGVFYHRKTYNSYLLCAAATKMPRVYKRKPESRKYGYSKESMEMALSDIAEKGLSIKKAAFLYGLNRMTLSNHLNGKRAGNVGRPTSLTPNEETLIVHAVQKLGDWGFGID